MADVLTSAIQIRTPSDVDGSPHAHTRTIEIEGHDEPRGAAALNQKGSQKMATMRPYLRRIDPGSIGLWAIGVLCGALLMVGVNAVHHTSHPATLASVSPAVTNQVAGMRDVQALQFNVDDENMIRHDPVGQSPASAAAEQRRIDQENMIRHDPVETSAAVNGRSTGPGEGLNQYRDTTSHELDSGQPTVGPGERFRLLP